jgi:hypothetical protein
MPGSFFSNVMLCKGGTLVMLKVALAMFWWLLYTVLLGQAHCGGISAALRSVHARCDTHSASHRPLHAIASSTPRIAMRCLAWRCLAY